MVERGFGLAGLVRQDNCPIAAHQRHVELRSVTVYTLQGCSILHAFSTYELYNSYEVTDWDCFMQLWASPWSHNSTNCNIYRIWLMLKYLYTTSLILSFHSSLHPPLWEPASLSASLQNGKCEHHHTQKKYYNTQLQKKAFSLSRSLSLPRSHRSLCDKPDILRENKSSHLF